MKKVRKRNLLNGRFQKEGKEWSVITIHIRLRRRYGKATKCEFDENHKANYFQWALKKGRKYKVDKRNYLMLCPSCHKKYDMNEKTRKKMSKAQLGKIITPEWREKIRLGMLRYRKLLKR